MKDFTEILYSQNTKEKLSLEEFSFYVKEEKIIKQICKNYPEDIFFKGNCEKQEVALTFDDAPDDICTPQILDILKYYEVKASFSVIGVYIEGNEELIRRMYREGHTILNHTYTHRKMTQLSEAEIYEELFLTEEKLFQLLGIRTLFVRPPYGDMDSSCCRLVFQNKYKIAYWSYNSFDWTADCKEDILFGMIDQIRWGDIILLHSYTAKEPTVCALPEIIEQLLKRSYRLVTLEQLMQKEFYNTDI